MKIRINPRKIDPHLVAKIREISGENINICMQCGTCGGVCPMYEEVDVPPRVMVMLAQLGMLEEIERANTCTTCASCHHCQVRCPRGLDLPRVMEALRQIRLRRNENIVEPAEIAARGIEDLPQIALVAAFRKLTA